MIRKCYRLVFNAALPHPSAAYWTGEIDEDYTSKKEWLKSAKAWAAQFNKENNTAFTVDDLFGDPDEFPNEGYRYCTVCGESFWLSEGHDCE